MNIEQLKRRFVEDPQFHALVHQFIHAMETANIQPYEVRDAAFLAELIFREWHAAPLILSGALQPKYVLGFATPGGFEPDHLTNSKATAESWIAKPCDRENTARAYKELKSEPPE